MKNKRILEIIRRTGALITGTHVIYTSGKHGSAYINKDAIYPHTQVISSIGKKIAVLFMKDHVQVVAAPAIGGIVLSQWVAYHLSRLTKMDVLAVYAEKEKTGSHFYFRRGYDKLISENKTLVVEDILTTGASAKKVVEQVLKAGGKVIGVGAIFNRGKVTAKSIGVPQLRVLGDFELEAWSAKKCPLCARNVPINLELGKGKELRNKHNS